MWLLTRSPNPHDPALEAAIAQVVESEAETCPACAGVLEAAGAVPASCPACGRVRDQSWQACVEELARRKMATEAASGVRGERIKT